MKTVMKFLFALRSVAWLMIITSVSAFLAMNFTGASTYTSLSGVRRELRLALPLQIAGGSPAVINSMLGRQKSTCCCLDEKGSEKSH